MRKLYTLLLLAATTIIYSCGNKNANPAPSTIVGKWNLQQQETKTYVNGAMTSDSLYTASADLVGTAQFNSDNTYTSQSQKWGMQLGTRTELATSSGTGNYTYSTSAFSITGTLAGFDLSFTAISGAAPTITLTSLTQQVEQMSANKMVVFFDISSNYSYPTGVTESHRTVNTLTYTK